MRQPSSTRRASSNTRSPPGAGARGNAGSGPFFSVGRPGKAEVCVHLAFGCGYQRGPGYQLRAPHPAGAGALKAEVSPRGLRAKSFEPQAYRALARSKPKYHKEDRALAGDRGIAGQGDKAHGCVAAENHHSLPREAMKRRSGAMAAKNHHSLPPGPLPKTRCCETASLTDTPPKDATNATLLHDFVITHCIL